MKIYSLLLAVCTTMVFSTENSFVKVMIQSIANKTAGPISINQTKITAQSVLRNPLLVPFISTKDYLREFVSGEPFIPEGAIRISSSDNTYWLWASESGVMCAQDPQNDEGDWSAFKILSNMKSDYSNQKAVFALLALSAYKNKLNISLKPIQN